MIQHDVWMILYHSVHSVPVFHLKSIELRRLNKKNMCISDIFRSGCRGTFLSISPYYPLLSPNLALSHPCGHGLAAWSWRGTWKSYFWESINSVLEWSKNHVNKRRIFCTNLYDLNEISFRGNCTKTLEQGIHTNDVHRQLKVIVLQIAWVLKCFLSLDVSWLYCILLY